VGAISITDATFTANVLNSDRPVLVFFYASWCGNCRVLEPLVDQIALRYSPNIKVFKFTPRGDLGDIKGFPTLAIYSGGQKVETVVASVATLLSSDILSKTIAKYL
jgi:thioredoxin 1